jgi:hypothetical protein
LQKPVPNPSPGNPKQSERSAEVDQLAAQKRVAAVSLLTSLADDARSFNDQELRARVQARIADALWDHDRPRATDLFRRAWAAAEAFEQEEHSGSSSLARVSGNQPPSRRRTRLRSEIMRLAARRDHALGEEFLAKITTADDPQSPTSANGQRELTLAERRERLGLANDFLAQGNVQRALEFARPALNRIDDKVIQFLSSVRDSDPVAADTYFASLLLIAAADQTADANTVSLLASYALTPSVYVVVTNTGIPSRTTYGPKPAPALRPELRRAYFRTAAGILLRPFSQIDQTSAGRAGTHFIAKGLLPFFQQLAPDLAPAIAAQIAALAPDASRHSAEESLVERGSSEGSPMDAIETELEKRVERAENADARDRAYAFAAMRAADQGEMKARDFVEQDRRHRYEKRCCEVCRLQPD